MSELKNWIKEFTKESLEQQPSHLLYDGGKIYLPRNREDEFLTRYAKELQNGQKLYYVETRPEVFKFMIDLDISDDHYWSDKEMQELVSFMQIVISEFFEKKIVICAVSDQKIKNDEIHTGIHLIFPSIFVNSENAMIIRRGLIQKLSEKYTTKKSWKDIIDEVIYTRNGFRMIGSDKMSKEKIPENRPLYLKFVMNWNGEINEEYLNRLKNDYVAMMLETSIRYIPNQLFKNKSMEPKIPSWLNDDELEFAFNNRKKVKKSGKLISSEEHLILEKFINEKLPEQYKGIVKAVTRYQDGNLLIKTNSRYCMNLGREHNSCGIYFFANLDGIYQKCLCPCDKIRNSGIYCKDYTSKCYNFNENLKEKLFPKYAEKILKIYNPKNDNKKFDIKKETAMCEKMLQEILN